MVSDIDIAWAAGVFEGEGCIGVYKQPDGRPNVAVKVVMSDEDVLIKFNSIFPSKNGLKQLVDIRKDSYKTCWLWGLYSKESTTLFLKTIYPYLGSRRRLKCEELFSLVATSKTKEEYYNRCCTMDVGDR